MRARPFRPPAGAVDVKWAPHRAGSARIPVETTMTDGIRMSESEEWTRRDELALQFMLALVEGDTAQGVEHPPGVLALKAYQFADGFLAVRDQENDVSAGESDEERQGEQD